VRLGLLIAVRAATAIVVSAAAVQFWALAVRGETPHLTPSLALPRTAAAVAAVGAGGAKPGARARLAPRPATAPPAVVVHAPLVSPHPARGRKPPSRPSAVPPAPGPTKPKASPPVPPAAQPQVADPPIVPRIAPAPPAPSAADEQAPDPHSHVAIASADPHGPPTSAAAGDQSRHEDDTHGKRSRP
jgi:hypothetical protein